LTDVSPVGEFEGYVDAEARDESRAWVSLLEGPIHAAIVITQQSHVPNPTASLEKPRTQVGALIHPPPPPLSGLSTPIPMSGPRISSSSVEQRFRQGIDALSERLGTDKWFLGSSSPTALDALAFAYLYSALQSQTNIRREVERRVNLVTWERKVRAIVQTYSSS
jgi:metaxin